MKKTFSVLAGLLVLIIITTAFSYDSPKFKNLKILPKDISEKAMDSVMHHYSASLGVGCDFCHVKNQLRDTWDMASDAKHEKQIARKMMLMTNEINIKSFSAEKGSDKLLIETITCYTCHHGHVIPADMPEKKEEKK